LKIIFSKLSDNKPAGFTQVGYCCQPQILSYV